MRQHGSAYQIAYGPNTGQIGLTLFVHMHQTTLVYQQAGFRLCELVYVGTASNCNNHTIDTYFLITC